VGVPQSGEMSWTESSRDFVTAAVKLVRAVPGLLSRASCPQTRRPIRLHWCLALLAQPQLLLFLEMSTSEWAQMPLSAFPRAMGTLLVCSRRRRLCWRVEATVLQRKLRSRQGWRRSSQSSRMLSGATTASRGRRGTGVEKCQVSSGRRKTTK
jgi:hypothetical protein